jgi:hypothetical protein
MVIYKLYVSPYPLKKWTKSFDAARYFPTKERKIYPNPYGA